MRRWPTHTLDALISDPPYATTDLAWDKKVDWSAFWEQVERVCKPDAPIVLFSAQPFTTTLINSNRAWFRYELIWEKNVATGWLDAKKRPMRAHENILIFARQFKGSCYNPQKVAGKPYKSKHGTHECQHYTTKRRVATVNETGERHPRSVLKFNNSRGGKSHHPTQKPLDLMTWLINSYTNAGDAVGDPFMGSGSTGVAAVGAEKPRRFFGIEKEAPYFQTAVQRIHAVAGY